MIIYDWSFEVEMLQDIGFIKYADLYSVHFKVFRSLQLNSPNESQGRLNASNQQYTTSMD
eukprot:6202776-Pleurochrysis_carterae.AAC.4